MTTHTDHYTHTCQHCGIAIDHAAVEIAGANTCEQCDPDGPRP